MMNLNELVSYVREGIRQDKSISWEQRIRVLEYVDRLPDAERLALGLRLAARLNPAGRYPTGP